jgi:hypothetical protein
MSDYSKEQLKQFFDNFIAGNTEQADVHIHNAMQDKFKQDFGMKDGSNPNLPDGEVDSNDDN